MKKLIALLLVLLTLAALTACASDPAKPDDTKPVETKPVDTGSSDTQPPAPAEITPADVEAAIAAALGEGYLATVDVPEDEMYSSPIAALDLEQLESYVAKQAAVPAVDLDSVVVVKCKPGYADEAVNAINESFAQTVSYIRQYPFGVAKVEGARLYKYDDLVIFVLAGASADAEADPEEEAKLASVEYDKIDAAIAQLFGSLNENLAVVPEQSEHHGGLIGG